jgi:hypothetical protein
LKLLEEGFLLLAKPQVIHSIPGRIRFHSPLLKRLGKQYHHWAEVVCELLKTPAGIENVSTNHITGTILLHYDPKVLTEKEILQFISSLSRVFVSQKDELARLIELDFEVVLHHLKDWLNNALSRRLHLDSKQRILLDDLF